MAGKRRMKDINISSQIPAVQDIIAGANNVGIVITDHYNLDKMAAGLAMYLSLKSAGKNVQIVSKKDPIVEVSNLVGVDKVKKSFDGSAKTLVVSLPYKEGEIEKVSYNIEGSRLNINLFAPKDRSINFDESQVEYIRTGATPEVLITFGIRSPQEMQGIIDDPKNLRIIAIDTSNANLNFAQVQLGDSAFSSASEVASALIEELKLPIDQDIAQNLLDGASQATNNFTSNNASPYAFQTAAFSLKNGARRKQAQSGGQQSQQQGQPQKIRQQPTNQQPIRLEQTQQKDNKLSSQQQEEVQPSQQMNQEQQNNQPQDQEEVPSDWFMPKVFKSSKNQQEE